MITFSLNGKSVQTDAPPDTPLLWVVRDYFKLKGSKFGCGMGLCGACSMQVNGDSVRTCLLPLSSVRGQSVMTIEGLGTPDNLHPIQQAWVRHNVPQCGYCQSGQIISASALLAKNARPSDDEIDTAMSGNICRCGTYPRIKKAIKDLASSEASLQKNIQKVQKQPHSTEAKVNIFDPAQQSVKSSDSDSI